MPFLYTFCVLDCASRFLMIFLLLIKKEEEINDRSFEDHERTLVELNDLFFKTLYHWATAFDFNIYNFHIF
jgi:hypothetical protein